MLPFLFFSSFGKNVLFKIRHFGESLMWDQWRLCSIIQLHSDVFCSIIQLTSRSGPPLPVVRGIQLNRWGFIFNFESFQSHQEVDAIIMAFMAVKRNRKKNQTKKNFDEIFKKFDHNQNQRVSIREFTEVGEDIFKGMVRSSVSRQRCSPGMEPLGSESKGRNLNQNHSR